MKGTFHEDKMKKIIYLTLILIILLMQSFTLGSLLSWSNVPEPAKSIMGTMGIVEGIFIVIFALMIRYELHIIKK
jgi:hypothetical protein